MDFTIGPEKETKEKFLEREGVLSPFNLKLSWDSVPKGFLPVVLIDNGPNTLAEIAVDEWHLKSLTDLSDNRKRTIYLVRIEKILPVAGLNFINYAKENGLVDDSLSEICRKAEEEKLLRANEQLFAGRPQSKGGLSNEDLLARICPPEFRNGNPWSEVAMKIFFNGGSVRHWMFKTADRETVSHQFACFSGLLGTFGIAHEDKEAVAGWMLANMLKKVPEYILAPE